VAAEGVPDAHVTGSGFDVGFSVHGRRGERARADRLPPPSVAMEPVWGLARCIAYPIRPFFHVKLEGRQHVPRKGPVLLASNHVSFVDPVFMLWLGERTRRKVRFLAMAELWNLRFLRFFLIHTHQIPVPRGTAAAGSSLTHAISALERGECLGIYPEGGISDDLEPMPGKTGVARLAAMTGAPVVPVGVWGGQRLYPKGRKRRFRLRTGISIIAGEPLHVGSDDDVCDATDRIMSAVAATVRRAREVYPGRPRRRDDGWWVRAPETAVMRPTRRDRVADRWS
jgi:1-acyl-sn-glycerol-3-phosphate acyltransferase